MGKRPWWRFHYSSDEQWMVQDCRGEQHGYFISWGIDAHKNSSIKLSKDDNETTLTELLKNINNAAWKIRIQDLLQPACRNTDHIPLACTASRFRSALAA